MTPASRSAPLTFPHVRITSPASTRSRLARQTLSFNASYGISASNRVADLEQRLHHSVHVTSRSLHTEGVVHLPVEGVEPVIDLAPSRIGLEHDLPHTGHRRHRAPEIG